MNKSKPATRHSPRATHTWTQFPNHIYEVTPQMDTAELKCTLALVRQTYGYHQETATLTYDDFQRLTGIKSRATIAAGTKAVLQRGFFRRGSGRSQWTIHTDTGSNNSSKTDATVPNLSQTEPSAAANHSIIEPPNSSKTEPNHVTNGSKIEPLPYNKKTRSPSGKERENESRYHVTAVAGSPDKNSEPAHRTPTAYPPSPNCSHPRPRTPAEEALLNHPAAVLWLELDFA